MRLMFLFMVLVSSVFANMQSENVITDERINVKNLKLSKDLYHKGDIQMDVIYEFNDNIDKIEKDARTLINTTEGIEMYLNTLNQMENLMSKEENKPWASYYVELRDSDIKKCQKYNSEGLCYLDLSDFYSSIMTKKLFKTNDDKDLLKVQFIAIKDWLFNNIFVKSYE